MDKERMPAGIDALFASYHDAVRVPEPSADFMPGLWAKIEQRQRTSYSFRRLASGFVTAAAALCIAMSLAIYNPSQSQPTNTPLSTYVDVLAAAADPAADVDPSEAQ